MSGLGDVIDTVTTLTGVKYVVKKINPDCDCEKRKEKLNEKFPINGIFKTTGK
jgi:hypothetical protein